MIVDLNKNELDAFMAEMNPQGLFLWIATDSEEEELEILKRLVQMGIERIPLFE